MAGRARTDEYSCSAVGVISRNMLSSGARVVAGTECSYGGHMCGDGLL